MKRLILIVLIPALVGCNALGKTQNQLLGAAIGAFAGYHFLKGHRDQDWGIALGALSGAAAGTYRRGESGY